MKKAIVYVPMSADIIHPGHIQILQEAQKYGQVIVGLLSDNAIKAKKGKSPIMSFDERYVVVSNLAGVSQVIKQKTPDYRQNLEKLKPEFVVHGNDWSKESRDLVLNTIIAWEGRLIETDYDLSPTTSSIIKMRVLGQSQ